MSRRPPRLCAYCGETRGLTKDHVPPRGVFPKPRSADLITVPCCGRCNQGFSRTDLLFRTYLSAQIGITDGAAAELWQQMVESGLACDATVARELLGRMSSLLVTDAAGCLREIRTKLLWDSTVHDDTVSRIVRGLYFHHRKTRLPPAADLQVRWHGAKKPPLPEPQLPWEFRTVANGQFSYFFVAPPQTAPNSAWALCFHDKHWCSATVRSNPTTHGKAG
jgi:hypothetical protein